MFQRSGQFPGYTIQEVVDSPRHYGKYLATEDNDPGQWVLIQSLSRELAHTMELRLGFQDACRQLARTRMDGIMTVREIGVSERAGIYIVHPHNFPSLTLGDVSVLCHDGILQVSPAFCASVLLEATRILDIAHQQQLCHFSLLPNNIHISPLGDITVTGFIEASMRRKYRFETELDAKFDAPEWRHCKSPGIASDVYAIGAFLYQLITDSFQPDEWEPRWTAMMIDLDRARIPGDSLATAIYFFQRALAERPPQRFQSYGHLTQALEQLIVEFGAYQPRELRAAILADHFPVFPPPLRSDSRELRSDVISLISGDLQSISGDLSCLSHDCAAIPITDEILVEEGETLMPASQEGRDTRVLQRSTGGFRMVSPALRSSITTPPLEILSRSRYQILDQLGSGGTGTVYKVLDTTLSEVLALKVLRPELVSDVAWLQRFKLELRITRDLEHAFILPAYHLEQLEGLYFFTMRYVDGQNLSERLRVSPPSFALSLRIMSQVGRALVAAHDRGIIHRDFKPANIMIESHTLHPYLMDFGIASVQDTPSVTIAGQGIGTPCYMAPEQSRGEPITPQADIYSFGVVCYECFVNRLPFGGKTAIAIYTAQVSGIFSPILETNPTISPKIATLIESCLNPVASLRPSSMRLVLDELDSALT